MQRVLDIDLDFFVQPVEHWVGDGGPRLAEEHFSCCSIEEAVRFLREQCGLNQALPGWVIEHHDEAFLCWRDAIESGTLTPPFHVTHVDAHADLGWGDGGFVYLITEVMHHPVGERSTPRVIEPVLNFANWLACAVACRWVSELDYVFCPGGGSDLPSFYRSNDLAALQMRAATQEQLDRQRRTHGEEPLQGVPDPIVPIRQIRGEEFNADGPFDAIVLCRSPGYTPASADVIFDLIRTEFVEVIS